MESVLLRRFIGLRMVFTGCMWGVKFRSERGHKGKMGGSAEVSEVSWVSRQRLGNSKVSCNEGYKDCVDTWRTWRMLDSMSLT